ncbi:MAG: hypothetical protein RMA76_03675 [Deltaproteobacteria bacterium]|jgi:hypothetical protein
MRTLHRAPIALFALAVGCSSTFEPENPCPEGTERQGNQCVPTTEPVVGCTDRFAENFLPRASIDDGSCTYSGVGCTDAGANNYNPTATTDDGSCRYDGCTDAAAVNFSDTATDDDGSCRYIATLRVDMSGVQDFDRADGVYVHGSFNNWCGTCAVLTDGDQDNVYRGTIVITAQQHNLRFVIGSDPIREEPIDAACGVTASGGLARELTMPAADTVFEPFTFGRCPAVSTELPLVVDDVYAPSGFMGDGESGGITAVEVCPTRAGDQAGLCHAFTYTAGGPNGWGGVFWQYPDGNWGEADGFPVPQGATRINFWAWGAQGGEVVKFLVGYAGPDGFALETPEITLAATPTEYQILLVGTDYADIAGGFGWVATSPGNTIEFYVDDIQYKNDPSDTGGGPGDGCTDTDAVNFDPNATNDDGSCEYNVTFSVDMSCTTETFTTVFVTGPFCSWCDGGFELTDPDTDGVYSGTFPLPAGPLEFKYMIDNFASQEDLIDDVMAGNGACAPVTDGATFANRQITVPDAPTTTEAAYGRCDTCP